MNCPVVSAAGAALRSIMFLFRSKQSVFCELFS